ncbi:Gfo/Idh/MocA family protein [Neobacillus cucumis]|uniref:Gfo/Idh/MocA family oxidoreductase n=1 Tax=Neobacillus cucumis TaxID=1740721 RepID=A0A2N5HSS4_9BACI|nr:Gfo/Idh/MocA family oxidoreductase [Neobacillus cucumis]PLS08576.1 gfo/Idh/MocA family oxidoreductase [Neobacillus cucumis]
MLKIAVIGLGDVSSIHINAINQHPNARLVAVCDIDIKRKAIVPSVNFYSNYKDMLENEMLDCVHICLPHYLHYPVTRACVEKGIHVFLEKPLALNTEEGLALVRLEEENKDLKINVCLQNRFNESFEMLQSMVDSGKYGSIKNIKGLVSWARPKSYYDDNPWRGKQKYAGGGVMINQSIHTLDLIQLLGGEIDRIRGSIDQLLDYGVEIEDTATARIHFKNGTKGFFFATIANGNNSSVELQVILDGQKLTIKDSILYKQNEMGKKIELIEDTKMPGSKFYYGASHLKLIHKFYQSIIENTQDYVHAKDALPSLRMIDMIVKSSENKQEIKMESLEALFNK